MVSTTSLARSAIGNSSKYILYADRSVIVLNKPPGLICQLQNSQEEISGSVKDGRSATNPFNLLLTDLKRRFQLSTLPYPVHRLDKSTTGVLVLARSNASAQDISQQFQMRRVEKTYLALVRGGAQSFEGQSKEIRDPIQIDDGRVSIGESCKARFAATDWELVATSPRVPLSLLKLKLHTGVKHQLRVHLAHALHTPILGDTVYTRNGVSEKITKMIKIPDARIFLHASSISLFRYRRQGSHKRFRLGIKAPLPRDFLKICADAGIELPDETDIGGGLFVDSEPVSEVPEVGGEWTQPRSLL